MAFFHGIQVTEVSNGGVSVQVVNSSVIGLIGTAPRWLAPVSTVPTLQVPTLVTSQNQASAFGPLVKGYTIPAALSDIQEQGSGAVIVVDVFDPNTHNTVFAAAAKVGPATNAVPVFLGHMGLVGPGLPNYVIAASTVTVKNSLGTTTYVEGTDYTIDYANGLLYTKAGGTITASQSLMIGYTYCDPSKVTAANIVGTVIAGVYTGLQALQLTFNLFGFFAKILITPGFADVTTSGACVAMAGKIRAVSLLDSPPAITVATCLTNRGTAGNAFNQASDRLVLCFPQQLVFDTSIDPTAVTVSAQGVIQLGLVNANAESPYSQWVAGAMAAKDQAFGYWFSPSNTVINGTLGPDINMYMSAFDPTADTNTLNAAGILTIFNGFGTGYRVWGNRASSFPSSSTPTTFISIRRTLDVIEQSIQVASLPFLDQPITNGLINSILSAVNAFIRSLIQAGALIGGSITYNPQDNPVNSIANGQLTFEVSVMPPPPAEEIIYNVFVDTSLLSQLGPTVSAANQAANVLPNG